MKQCIEFVIYAISAPVTNIDAIFAVYSENEDPEADDELVSDFEDDLVDDFQDKDNSAIAYNTNPTVSTIPTTIPRVPVTTPRSRAGGLTNAAALGTSRTLVILGAGNHAQAAPFTTVLQPGQGIRELTQMVRRHAGRVPYHKLGGYRIVTPATPNVSVPGEGIMDMLSDRSITFVYIETNMLLFSMLLYIYHFI